MESKESKIQPSKTISVLVSDLGGTNARFCMGILDTTTGIMKPLAESKRYKTKDF